MVHTVHGKIDSLNVSFSQQSVFVELHNTKCQLSSARPPRVYSPARAADEGRAPDADAVRQVARGDADEVRDEVGRRLVEAARLRDGVAAVRRRRVALARAAGVAAAEVRGGDRGDEERGVEGDEEGEGELHGS